MEEQKLRLDSPELTNPADAAAIRYLEQAIKGGKHWYIALLESMRLWNSTEEIHNDRTYRYLIASEAFDWLLLAERLCGGVDSLLPDTERDVLLFYGRPPLRLSKAEFSGLIGSTKHRQYLNYFYGITVEEALLLAVQEEVRKEWRTLGYVNDHNATSEAYRRIYGDTRTALFRRFRYEKGHPRLWSVTLTTLREFTYWLFKYRLKHSDKTRFASDTRKALEQLDIMGFSHPW